MPLFPTLPDINPYELLWTVLSTIWELAPYWLPIMLLTLFIRIYMRYMNTKWISEQGHILLEIKIPKEVQKSPKAMEIIIGSFHQTGVGSLLDVYLKGRVRPWFSLELVSIGGEVHFFVWTPPKLKNVIEAQIYSQFPQVEVHEVQDYALNIPYNPAEYSMFGTQLVLSKADAYPIKTYIDYELHKDPKEEFKVDPITPVLEFLGSIGPGNQVWIQILIRAHKSEGLKEGRLTKKPDWSKAAKKEVEKIMGEALFKPEGDKPPTQLNLSEMQMDTIKSIERSLSKPAFDSMIRMIYLAPKDSFNPINIGGMLGSFKQFSSNNLNGFRPGFTTSYDYPWHDFRSIRKTTNERKILDAYKRRSYFYPPYKNFGSKLYILTTEELATLFHFPGGVATTPTFTRILSKKAEPPSNLPV